PVLELAYSSRGGVSTCGVGWDLPPPLITLNLEDGFRPNTLEEDLARYEPGSPVERYTSHFGTIAVIKDLEDYSKATKTFLFNPNNDYRVEPIRDSNGEESTEGDVAAFQVTTKEGTTYRYGYEEYSSLYQYEGNRNARKVAWYLDQVEDAFGNL